MKCCKQEVTTNFCPHCGKEDTAVTGNPLLSLLRHTQNNLKIQQAQLAKQHEWQHKHHDNDTADRQERRARNLRRDEKNVAKWQRWTDALKEALNTPD